MRSPETLIHLTRLSAMRSWRSGQTRSFPIQLRRNGSRPASSGPGSSRIENVDNDPTLDVWTISSESRQAPDGMSVPPGSPRNDVNDVIE